MKKCQYCLNIIQLNSRGKKRFCNYFCSNKFKAQHKKKTKRNEEVISLAYVLGYQEIADKLGMTYQRVGEIIKKYNQDKNLHDVILKRKQRAIIYADQYNKFTEPFRKHL
jgi:hypothetical protein